MTPQEKAILQLMAVAEQAGLAPVVEVPDHAPPCTVDLRIVRRERVVAAIRAVIDHGVWRYQCPARPGGEQVYSWDLRYLGKLHRVTEADLRVLDPWWGRIPGTGRLPVPPPPPHPKDTPRWMVDPRYWHKRIGLKAGWR